MHYYPELKNPNVSNLAPYVWQEKNEKILLAEDGLYKYIDWKRFKLLFILFITEGKQERDDAHRTM